MYFPRFNRIDTTSEISVSYTSEISVIFSIFHRLLFWIFVFSRWISKVLECFQGAEYFSVVMQSIHANTVEIFKSDPFRRAVTGAAAASGNVSNPV